MRIFTYNYRIFAGRYPVAKRPPALKNETDRRKVDNACGLLGLADAVILNRIQINQSSSGVYDSGNKDVDSTSTVHQNLTNLSSVPFKDRDKPSETRKSTPHVPQILCGVFTTAKNHNPNVKAMMETWASKCSFFISFSTENDPEYNAFDLPHLGDESYYNMWQKSRSIWKYIHHNYMDDFDYFMLGGDDMYVIMENLHEFLLSNKVIHTEAGLYLGRRLVLPFDQIPYNAGGPGYLLDRVALKVLVANLDRPHCHPDLGDSKEDVFLSFCLQSSIEKIFPFNTTADSLGR